MNNRDRAMAILNYQKYDRLPLVNFGYWDETLVKWAQEGHMEMEDALNWADGTPVCKRISVKLGFDFNWFNTFGDGGLLDPEGVLLLWSIKPRWIGYGRLSNCSTYLISPRFYTRRMLSPADTASGCGIIH